MGGGGGTEENGGEKGGGGGARFQAAKLIDLGSDASIFWRTEF